MLAKFWTSLTVLLVASLEVNGHAAVSPVLGLSGEPQRKDVKIPTLVRPCGLGVNVASALDKSTPVQAAPDGTFTATITNFNPGRDGSRQVTARVDAAATGKNANFVDMTVSQNGDAAPPDNGSQQIVAALPAGTKCTGGTSGDLCLVSFKTLGRFGNCIAVQQAGGANAGSAGADATGTGTGTGDATGGDATGTNTGTGATGSGATGTNTGTGATGSGATRTGAGTGAANAAGTGATGSGTGASGAGAKNNVAAGGKTATSSKTGTSGAGANNNVATGGKAATGSKTGTAAGAKNNVATGGKAAAGTTTGKSGATQTNQANSRLANTKGRLAQGGTRAARALLADLEDRGEELGSEVRRGFADLIWA